MATSRPDQIRSGLRQRAVKDLRIELTPRARQYALDIRPRVREATGGRPRWMTAAPSASVTDSAALLGEPMTASCQVP